TTGRRGPRHRRPARLRPDPVDAGAAHPAGEGHLQHLHQRGAVRPDRGHLPGDPRQERPQGGGDPESRQGRLRQGADRGSARLPDPVRGADLQRVRRRAAGACGGGRSCSLRPRSRAGHPALAVLPGAGARPPGDRDRAQPPRRDRSADRRAGGPLLTMDSRTLRPPEKLLFEISRPGHRGSALPPLDIPDRSRYDLDPRYTRRAIEEMPELSEVEVVRHYTRLSRLNYAIDLGLYPLGSCTMKYNPKANEKA